jgi:phosphatidylserine/phosphatidylglycerophosphate/cardiolipin synthase-like enzyme
MLRAHFAGESDDSGVSERRKLRGVKPIPDSLDAALGGAIEATVRLKHRARLSRLGHPQVLSPRRGGLWATADASPREGCRLEVLIDGSEAFPRIAEAIAVAQSYVHIAGWHLAPSFELVRGTHPIVLGELLAETAERIPVRVLVWAGSPVPVFHPTRDEVAETLETLKRRTRIRVEADPREHPVHCHHEKVIVIDGRLAFVGGIDMTDLAGDRYDLNSHPARRRLGWHDVGTCLQGPAVADVADHFAMRWRELTGEQLEGTQAPEPAGRSTVQVTRTVANGMYDALPRGEFGVFETYLAAIESAELFIYLENQFLWSPEIVARLAAKLRKPPVDDFRIVILLPSRANNGQDDTSGQLGVLLDADAGHGRILATTIRSLTGTRDDRLYVHAKVGIVDDRWMTIGSANLNAHSLLNDTEMNVVTDDRELIRDTRLRLWAEHLELDPSAIAHASPHSTIDERWRPTALDQLQRLRADAPATHRLLALPGASRRSRRLLGPLTGLFDDG